MSRSMKARRKARKARKAEKAAQKGKVKVPRGRNLEVLGMILGKAGRAGNHGDAKKEKSRKACREKVEE